VEVIRNANKSRAYHGQTPEMSLDEVAEIMGLSRQMVAKIEHQALAKMRKRLQCTREDVRDLSGEWTAWMGVEEA
jgi:DNA-directed RNA polymerase sigma subunit (sigma70/sigma32)